MSMTKILCDTLAADTDLSTAVGGRIFGAYAPSNTDFPFVIVTREGFDIEDDISPSELTDLRSAEYEITVWAQSTVDTEALEELVLSAAMFGRKHEGSIVVQSQDFNGGNDVTVPPVDGSQEAINAVDLNFTFNYLVNQPEPTP